MREKLIPKLERANHIKSGKGVSEVLLESGDGAFDGIDPMVVRGGKLDVDRFGPDVLLDRGGTLFALMFSVGWKPPDFRMEITLVNACTIKHWCETA